MQPLLKQPVMNLSGAETNGKTVLECNGRHYSVNDVTLLIIRTINEESSSDKEILKKVKKLFPECCITEHDVKYVRETIVAPKRSTLYIRLKIRILNLEKHMNTFKYLSYMIDKYLAVLTISLFFFLLIFEGKTIFSINYSETLSTISNNRIDLLMLILLSIVSILFHELGHAAAACKFNVAPKEIGFGFYLFFPAMFTDVSSAWMATKKQRICIDLSGFYFQIILVDILMIFLIATNVNMKVLYLIIWNNLFIILYNLNPLFRFDGYWIISDIFGITNLKTKSSKALPDLICRLINSEFRKRNKLLYPTYIYIYSVISNIFITVMVALFCISFIKHAFLFVEYISTIPPIDKQLSIYVLKLCFLCICLYISLNSIVYKYKTLIYNVIQLFKKGRKSIRES